MKLENVTCTHCRKEIKPVYKCGCQASNLGVSPELQSSEAGQPLLSADPPAETEPVQIEFDVTDNVRFGSNDGDLLPLYKCMCGREFDPWDFILNPDEWKECDCGIEYKFSNKIIINSKTPPPAQAGEVGR